MQTLDFTGIDPTLTDPSSVTLPTMPTIPDAPLLEYDHAHYPNVDEANFNAGLSQAYTDISSAISTMITVLSGILTSNSAIEQAMFQRALDRESACYWPKAITII